LMQDYKKEEKRFTQDVDLFFCVRLAAHVANG